MAKKTNNEQSNHEDYEVSMIIDQKGLQLMGLTQFAAEVKSSDYAELKVSVLKDKTIMKLEPIEQQDKQEKNDE